MTSTSAWSGYSKNLYTSHKLGIYLDLNASGLSPEQIQNYKPLIDSACTQMAALENGAIANPDENRQVGHYWLRNSELAPSPELGHLINKTNTDIQSFANKILNGKIRSPSGQIFSQLLLIGIGGSALGPQFIADALDTKSGLNIHFMDNTDPDGIDRVLVDLSPVLTETLIIVISKSGGTAETRNGMLETQNAFKQADLNFAKHAVAITGEGSQLHKLATQDSWLSIFPMWDWVGGRTSVMSAVGLLPAALLGINIDEFLNAASVMDELTRSKQIENNPASLLAIAWYALGDGKGDKDMVILPYKDRLILFSRYLQQLIMESLGKRLDLEGNLVHQGIAVYGNKGSTDQHAYVQQLRDGLNNFFVTFIEVLSDRKGESITVDGVNNSGDYLFGFYKGTQTALKDSDRNSITITIPDISAQSMGALIALYERAVGLYASMIGINAYHQPGVEAGKKAAGDVLTTKNRVVQLLSEVDEYLNIEQISQRLELSGDEILIYQILRHFAANHALSIQGSFFEPESLSVKID